MISDFDNNQILSVYIECLDLNGNRFANCCNYLCHGNMQIIQPVSVV